ncbi:hypothetical protein GDO86_014577 [Hymenochirus boettgeri]|uniref:Uncharacterized protein n=1 Tax=Hymenochirus boettgeri TaxID=247094 RepID=A0A8T2JPD6_9PIPI|nr:hypothetical protein GDO86_014577 [Hymenochirus boettgeri]
MASSQGGPGSLIHRGRSHSDPSIITEPGSRDSPEDMAQSAALRAESGLGDAHPPSKKEQQVGDIRQDL